MKLNFEQKAVTSEINRKSQNGNKIRGKKILRNPSRQIPKWEILEKIQNISGKINAHKGRKQKKKGEHNKQTKKQGTEFSAIYPN